ncbi:DNA polymerase zeta catalytic subunit [Camelus dromedarius]|uniref:DNA polymerase zeta catalytic subunit n=1 Tax=Camelus dromedarius TaxID=9838 RepID=A0A5N4DX20_CAMDR|nr:DNA polymerase zeta catalytic subunit [Camelus dromedarius]
MMCYILGQKTCLHLHGIFPYLYVPYDGYGQQPESYLSQMAFSIDRALNVALGNPSSTAQHVFKVSLVSGMPFYGYHEKERHFMKIYLYNPAMVKRICELLQSGAIMNKFYQPHEAHIPYLLQLFIDYNLYGMNLINLAAVKFRKARRKSNPLRATGYCKDRLPGKNSLTGTLFQWEEDEIPSSSILEGVEPQSTCELEVDAVAADILNRLDIEGIYSLKLVETLVYRPYGKMKSNGEETEMKLLKLANLNHKEKGKYFIHLLSTFFNALLKFKDRRFMPTTESEKKFQKRLQEILKQNDFSVRTLSGSVDYSDGSQEFSAELTLHSEVLSPEILQCTPANMVEVHKDTELIKGHTRHKVEEALINEEAILNLMENSQTFQPLTQRLSESPVFLDSSPDETVVHLLAGLENDGYQGERNRMPPPCRSFGNNKNPQNSDDEENEPQIEKEEMELSLVMSQRWDSNIEEHCAKKRSLCRNTHRSSTEEDDSSSEEEMEWSNNSLLLANLSIPQLDGTADENSDSFVDCHFGDGTLETEQSFGLYGNKYTLRAKRKVNYETEDTFGEGQSGLAVLKELLQKRQQKAQNATSMQDPLSNKQQPNKTVSGSLEHNRTIKRTRSVTSPRKPRTPRSTKPKEKIPKLLKVDSVNLQNSSQLDNSLSDDSPIFFSDPGFESCYSLEDSLSPEHNYNFDINTIGQSGFCSFYSGSQFVPADQNLPQKFLSDAVQDLFPGQTIEKTEFLSHENQKCDEDKHHASDSTSWIRSGTLSPELFEKSSIESNENRRHNQWKNSFHPLTTRSNSIMDSFCVQQSEDCLHEKSRLNRSSVSKEVFLSLSQPSSSNWIQGHTRKEMGQPLDAINTSFTAILSSPDGELVDAASEDLELYVSRNNDMLTPTPDSSPRSTSSPSQSKNGSFIPRTAHILKPLMSPPSREEIMATLLDHDLSETIYQEPFCSNPSDVPEKPREIGGRLLMVETRLPNDLAEFEGDFSLEGLRLWKTAFSAMTQNPRPGSPLRSGQAVVNKGLSNSHKMVGDKKIVIMPCKCAPSRQLVQTWLQAKEEYERSKKLSKTEPTGVVKSAENFSSSANPDDKPVVPPKMDTTPHILLTTAHTKEDVDNSQIALQAPTTGCSQTASESQTLPPVASANDAEKDEDDDDCYVSYSSPDSPVIPPWQQTTSPDSKTLNGDHRASSPVEEQHSLTIENLLKPIKDGIQKSPCSESQEPLVISPINVRTRTGICESLCLHSTPIIQRKLLERLPEATGLSPLSAEPKTQKLSHKKGSNTDAFRRVLLTQAKNQFAAVNTPKKETSEIDGPSLSNTYGFKVSVQNLQEAKALHEIQNLTLISVELHARTRRDLEPDPEFDPICALFYCISSDTPLPDTDKTELTGVIVIDKDKTVSSQDVRSQTPLLIRSGITGLEVTYAADEKALFQEVADIIKRYDPDILLGYEIQMHSWGYLLQRAAALSVDLCQMISRVPDDKTENRFTAERDDYGSDTMSEINIVGRITLNLWRIMRNEVALTNYTFENVSFHVLHQRFPLFTFRVLSD